MKRITVITGHYGSGKSTFAANLAISRAEKGEKITVVDMDTVNPYYRTADLAELFKENGVALKAPMYANTNLDVPVLDFDIPALYSEGGSLIIDLGGDDAGAFPLGKFRSFLKEHEAELEILYIVNFCRCLTSDIEGASEILSEIESACGMKVTAIVNNSNLGYETDKEIIDECRIKAEEFAKNSALPLYCTTVPRLEACKNVCGDDIFPLNIYIKNVWVD